MLSSSAQQSFLQDANGYMPSCERRFLQPSNPLACHITIDKIKVIIISIASHNNSYNQMSNPVGLPSVCSTSVPYQLFYRAVSNTSASRSVSDFSQSQKLLIYFQNSYYHFITYLLFFCPLRLLNTRGKADASK